MNRRQLLAAAALVAFAGLLALADGGISAGGPMHSTEGFWIDAVASSSGGPAS